MRAVYPSGPAVTPGTVSDEMSATVKATGLSAGHGARVLFSGLDLVLAPGDVVGLVGANGAGKSTLLRILAGETAPEEGTVAVSPPAATVGHLPQEPDRRPGETVAAFLARRTGVAEAQAAMDAAAEALGSGAPGADDAYATALDRWLALGGADLDERAGAVADDVGLGVALDTPMTALSGGQAARAGLAALLLSRYDVLLLDEPTNDLDLDGLERLERFVAGLRSPARHRQPRPGVPRPHGQPDRRAGPRAAAGRGLRGRLRQLPRRARGRPPARARGLRGVRRQARGAQGPRASCSATGWRRACATPGARRPTTTRSAATSAQQTSEKQAAKARQTRAADRAAGRRRGAAQGVGAADDDRRGAPLGDGRGVAVRRGGAPRVVHARAGRRPGRLGGPGRDHRGERVGQVDAAGRAARAHPAGRGQRRAGLVRAGRRDRPGARAVPRAGAAGPGVPRRPAIGPGPTGRRATSARCWRSSG